MKLTLEEANPVTREGVYRVNGLPSGEEARIAEFDNAWRFLRWNETWHGNWTGQYSSAESALAALRDDLNSVVAV